MSRNSSNTPFLFHQPDPQARLRLFCFPYAGGGASLYRRWPRPLAAGLDVCPVQLPGRENRFRDKPFTRMESLVEALQEELGPYLDLPFAFFGYSLGGLVSFYLTRGLRSLGREPRHLLLAASRAAHLASPHAPILHLPDDAFLAALSARYDGMQSFVLSNPELLSLYLPVMKADFAILESRELAPPEPSAVPITVLAGEHDHATPPPDVEAWRQHTTGRFNVLTFPGGHFFINDRRDDVLAAVKDELRPYL